MRMMMIYFYFKFGNFRHNGYFSAQKLFDFKKELTAEILFYPGHYSSYKSNPNDVVDRIKYLIDNGEDDFCVKVWN
jgi:hypothetical protein